MNDGIDYTTKDNSKLRVILRDRELPDQGTREQMIESLQLHPARYDEDTAEELTEKLHGRHCKYAGQGDRANKIGRLEHNDSLDRDAANYGDLELWVDLKVMYTMLDEKPGSRSSKTRSPEELNKLRADFDSKKAELEKRVGHPVIIPEDLMKCNSQWHGKDDQIFAEGERNKQVRPRISSCDYDDSNSHWASRSERELTDICKRREMPGGGYSTKAGLLKWLDTGELDYAGLYMGGLERICRERQLTHKATAKKVDLIALLEKDDAEKDDE
jgi:hypothetical protein